MQQSRSNVFFLLALALTSITLTENALCEENEVSPALTKSRILTIYGPGSYQPLNLHPVETVLETEDISESPQFGIDEVLKTEAGLDTFRRSPAIYSHPTTQGASWRGTGATAASRSTVLLDGVPLNDPFGGWVYWNRVPRSLISRIRVSPQWESLTFSALGLTGSVEISTAIPPWNSVRLLGGSFGTAEAEASLSETIGEGAFGAAFRSLHSDGYYLLEPEQRGVIDQRSEIDSVSTALTAETSLGVEKTFTATANVYREDKNTGTALTDSQTEIVLLGSSLRDSHFWRGEAQANVFFQLQRFDTRFSSQAEDRASETPALTQHVPAQSLGTSLSWSRESDDSLLFAGVDWRYTSGSTQESFFFDRDLQAFRRGREAGGRQMFSGAYLGAKRHLLPSLLVSAALRGDYWNDSGLFQSTQNLQNNERLTFDDYGNESHLHLTPKLAFELVISDSLSVISSLQHAVRAATLNELVRPFRVRNDITLANENLDAEKLYGADLGLKGNSGSLSGSAVVFYNIVEDQVVNLTLEEGPVEESPCGRLAESGVCRRRSNIPRGESYGLELRAEHKISEMLSTELRYFYTQARFADAGGNEFIDGRDLPQIPQHRMSAGLTGEYDRFRWLLQGRFVGSQFEDDRNSLQLDSYSTIDASAGYRIYQSASVFLEAENILDSNIEVAKTADGLVTRGAPASIRAGVELRF